MQHTGVDQRAGPDRRPCALVPPDEIGGRRRRQGAAHHAGGHLDHGDRGTVPARAGGDLPAEEVPVPGEDELYELMKETFDARDVEE